MTQQAPETVRGGLEHHRAVDTVGSRPKRVLMVVANPAVSSNNGWPVGFWAAELTHPYYELTERGIEVTIASPNGGKVSPCPSPCRDQSRWSLASPGLVLKRLRHGRHR